MSLRRPLRVLGDGLFENGRRVTAKPFSCMDFKMKAVLFFYSLSIMRLIASSIVS